MINQTVWRKRKSTARNIMTLRENTALTPMETSSRIQDNRRPAILGSNMV